MTCCPQLFHINSKINGFKYKNQRATSYTNKNQHVISSMMKISLTKRKISIQVYEKKNLDANSFKNKISTQQVPWTEISTQLVPQKNQQATIFISFPNWTKSVFRVEIWVYMFHEKKSQHAANFTNRNQHAASSKKKKISM